MLGELHLIINWLRWFVDEKFWFHIQRSPLFVFQQYGRYPSLFIHELSLLGPLPISLSTKYILQQRQKHFTTQTNTFCNKDKYILQQGQIERQIPYQENDNSTTMRVNNSSMRFPFSWVWVWHFTVDLMPKYTKPPTSDNLNTNKCNSGECVRMIWVWSGNKLSA